MNALPSQAIPATPTFDEFVSLKQRLDMSGAARYLIDLSETRMAKVLAPHLTNDDQLQRPAAGHRCHVAEAWLAAFGLPPQWKPRALVSQGVRASLGALLGRYAREGVKVALPGDVYPVYFELARQAGASVQTFSSLRAGCLEATLTGASAPDVVVVAEPFKPRGTHITDTEMQALLAWLQGNRGRRVVVDAVYTFDTRLSDATTRLLDTQQAIVLHSLSKGWARPLQVGVALVPDADIRTLTPVFRDLMVDREALRTGQGLLERDRDQPQRLRGLLRAAEVKMREALVRHELAPSVLQPQAAMQGQYLFLVGAPWTELLRHHVLAMPVSVFGSDRTDLSIVSSLRYVAVR